MDALLDRGATCVTVLDVSHAALQRAQQRLGEAAAIPVWIESDVTDTWELQSMDIWHDRAVFHFLTEPKDQARYVARLHDVLKPGGAAIIATFAPNGPDKCSGLPVARYSPETLARTLGDAFSLVESRCHVHRTPWESTQAFQYSRLVKLR